MLSKMSASQFSWNAIFLAGVAIFGTASVEAACLSNQSGRTVYAKVTSNRDGGEKIGNLVMGAEFCLPVAKGQKATAKITPYAGARMGCKVEIVGDETLELVKFGTMNNCTLVPGR